MPFPLIAGDSCRVQGNLSSLNVLFSVHISLSKVLRQALALATRRVQQFLSWNPIRSIVMEPQRDMNNTSSHKKWYRNAAHRSVRLSAARSVIVLNITVCIAVNSRFLYCYVITHYTRENAFGSCANYSRYLTFQNDWYLL